MDIRYDPEADALYVTLRSIPDEVRTHPIDKRRIVDYDLDGVPVGVEFLFVSKGIDLNDVPEAPRIRQLLASLHDIPALAS